VLKDKQAERDANEEDTWSSIYHFVTNLRVKYQDATRLLNAYTHHKRKRLHKEIKKTQTRIDTNNKY
jgi:hypothetical protein